MSYSLNSFKGPNIGDYIGDYYRWLGWPLGYFKYFPYLVSEGPYILRFVKGFQRPTKNRDHEVEGLLGRLLELLVFS